jgi:hypothetical protein
VEFGYQDKEPRSSSTPVAGTVAASAEHEVRTLYQREISDTTTAICLRSEIAKASMAIPLTMEITNVLAPSCLISSLKVMIMGLLALADDPQNDDSGIQFPYRHWVKSRRLLLHHRDIVVGFTRT